MKDTEAFLKVLDPDDTSTGGGSAAAISGAMAGALIAMVCHLSSRTPRDTEDVSTGAAALAMELSEQLLVGSQDDTQAFQSVRAAYKLPKGTDEERQARHQAVQAAWLEATQIPLVNAARCLRVATLGFELQGRTSPAAQSDLNCAILLAQAGALACLENVATNLPSIQDPDRASHLRQQAASVRGQLSSLPAAQLLGDVFDPSLREAKTR